MQLRAVSLGNGDGAAATLPQSATVSQVREHQPPRQKPGLKQSVSDWQQPPGPRGGSPADTWPHAPYERASGPAVLPPPPGTAGDTPQPHTLIRNAENSHFIAGKGTRHVSNHPRL